MGLNYSEPHIALRQNTVCRDVSTALRCRRQAKCDNRVGVKSPMKVSEEQETRAMEESVRAQIETQLSHLDGLIRRGRQIRERLGSGASNPVVMAETRAWQEHCGTTINQLSGGSKAHWLARSFSNAFLMRSADGRAAEGVPPDEIVTRLLDVLGQAVTSLSEMSGSSPLSEASSESPRRVIGYGDSSPVRVCSQP